MVLRSILKLAPINIIGAATGMVATIYITWLFGVAVFANYTINMAKISILLVGLELIPSSFSIFRQQDDITFNKSLPSFYLCFCIVALSISAIFIFHNLIEDASIFMIAYLLLIIIQRYIDVYCQAAGLANLFLAAPAISNISRLIILSSQTYLIKYNQEDVPDILWSSLAIGTAVGQIYLIVKTKIPIKRIILSNHINSMMFLFRIRSEYYAYYLNSILKRFKDNYFAIFCDIFVPDKAEAGRFLLYFRSVDFSCAQVRLLEVLLSNREIRQSLSSYRPKILTFSSMACQAMSFLLSMVLMYRQGWSFEVVAMAFGSSLYIYPYTLELFKRSDAYSTFSPSRVTISLVSQVAVSLSFLLVLAAMTQVTAPLLIIGMIIGQAGAAVSYYIFPILKEENLP